MLSEALQQGHRPERCAARGDWSCLESFPQISRQNKQARSGCTLCRTSRRISTPIAAKNFTVPPATRTLPNGGVIVRTEVARSNNTPVEIDYLMRLTVCGWKAVNALSDSTISRVAVQRCDFRGVLTSGGALRPASGVVCSLHRPRASCCCNCETILGT